MPPARLPRSPEPSGVRSTEEARGVGDEVRVDVLVADAHVVQADGRKRGQRPRRAGPGARLQPPRGNRRPLAALLDERHLGEVERDVQVVEPSAQRLPRKSHDHVIGGDQSWRAIGAQAEPLERDAAGQQIEADFAIGDARTDWTAEARDAEVDQRALDERQVQDEQERDDGQRQRRDQAAEASKPARSARLVGLFAFAHPPIIERTL